MTRLIRLTKHQALGNDFLVWIGGDVGLGPEMAMRWCERRRGVGADGLLIALPQPDGVWQMVLFNADGSRAEMSGNGIRCFVQAVSEGRPGLYRINTDTGLREVALSATDDPNTVVASVEMGEVRAGRPSVFWNEVGAHPDRPVAHLDLGNPHTVVGVDDVTEVDLAAIGGRVPDVNLEVVHPGPEPTAITMRVHERGAGITEACGTGACASAWAAVQWGLVPASVGEVLVHMDGGDARVLLNLPSPGRVTLVGPSVYIGSIEIPVGSGA
jgi:diaminopimelate epimerase